MGLTEFPAACGYNRRLTRQCQRLHRVYSAPSTEPRRKPCATNEASSQDYLCEMFGYPRP